ncbi:DNA-binding response regulator, NarL/FixJ family, contains REC and HTH domains [[Luteovulum] sphaeroides subsp. megalophilum]|uniref:response regulator transcription factor n=1 Tax=Cereibacter sphaeroides TaxID=1063 RepID=UPI000B76813D|nr:response regulator transcription factor [Cereibacter sphaeroides]SNT19438.1 DNA-binding response regulator, NarL/FixJ family, contains REC and HTH domains [[Luteovulum] sphaeroides subsp. megalophilum]
MDGIQTLERHHDSDLSHGGPLPAPSTPRDPCVSIISDRGFERECLATSLKNLIPGALFRGYGNEAAWRADAPGRETDEVLLFSLGSARIDDEEMRSYLLGFIARVAPRRVVVLGEHDDAASLFEAIDCGAASYIPSSVGLEELVAAIRFSCPRSVLVPRKSIMALRHAMVVPGGEDRGLSRFFTDRQLDVARALLQGAANKTIAHELNLCESTVKVHIRNIMRKLKATNRTQAAFRLNQIADGSFSPDCAQRA